MTDTSPPNKYTIGLVQMAMSTDPAVNLEKAIGKVAEAAASGASLVCLPELFRSQYFAQREDSALFGLSALMPVAKIDALGLGSGGEKKGGAFGSAEKGVMVPTG